MKNLKLKCSKFFSALVAVAMVISSIAGFVVLDTVTTLAEEITEIDVQSAYEFVDEGQYIIAILYSGTYYAVSSAPNDSGYPTGVAITVDESAITSSSDISSCIFTYSGEDKSLTNNGLLLVTTTSAAYSITADELAGKSWLSKHIGWIYDSDNHYMVDADATDGNIYTLNFTGSYCGTAKASYNRNSQDAYIFRVITCTHEDGSTFVEAKSPTCTEDGNTEYYKCNTCSKAFADEKMTTPVNPILQATGHTWVLTSEDSLNEYYECSVCHETSTVEKDPRLAQITLIGVTAEITDSGSYPWIVNPLTDSNSGIVTNGLISSNQKKASSNSDTTITFSSSKEFTLSFDYACQSENAAKWDYLTVFVDGTSIGTAGGNALMAANFSQSFGAGSHTIRVYYVKDTGTDTGADTGYIYNIVAAVNCEHTSLTHYAAISHTCTTDGNIEYWECDNCHKTFSDSSATAEVTDVIDLASHTYTQESYIANYDGTHKAICTVCNEETTEDCDWVDSADGTTALCSKCGATAVKNKIYTLGSRITSTPSAGGHIIFVDSTSPTYAMSNTASGSYLKADGVRIDGTTKEISRTDGVDISTIIWETTKLSSYFTIRNVNTGAYLGITANSVYTGTTSGNFSYNSSSSRFQNSSNYYGPNYNSNGYFSPSYYSSGTGYVYYVDESIIYTPVYPHDQHIYPEDDVAWNWADDYSSATATFICKYGDDTQIVNATVSYENVTAPTCTEVGTRTYTASATYGGTTASDTQANISVEALGHSYEDGKCIRCGASEPLKVEIGADATTGYHFAPYGNYYKYSTTQQIYTPEDIGRSGGEIKSLAFKVTSSGQTLATDWVKVYLGHKSSTFSSATDAVTSTNLTLVYSGNPTLGQSTGWEKLEFNENTFEWNGEDNLVVVVAKYATSYNQNLKYAYFENNVKYAIYRQNDNTSSYGDVSNISNYTYTTTGSSIYHYRPSIQLEFEEKCDHTAARTFVEQKDPTCTETGLEAYYVCSQCGKWFKSANTTDQTVVTEDDLIIAALGHDIAGVEATSNNNDTHSFECTRCHELVTEDCTYSAALHDNNDGTHTLVCEVCGYQKTEDCDFTDHEDDNYSYCACGSKATKEVIGSGYVMTANTGTPSAGDMFIFRNNSTSSNNGVNMWKAMNTTYKTGNYNGFAWSWIQYDSDGNVTYPESDSDIDMLIWVYEPVSESATYGYLKNYSTGEYIYCYYNHLYPGQPDSTIASYSSYTKATFVISGTTTYLGTTTSSNNKLYWDNSYQNFAGFTSSTASAYKVTGGTETIYTHVPVEEPKVAEPVFEGHSLVLTGQIGVQFGVKLPDGIENYPGSYMTFEGNKINSTVKISTESATEIDGKYFFAANISSIQMAEKITPTFHYFVDDEEKTVVGSAYSAEDYLRFCLIDNPNFLAGDEKHLEVAKALADYGYYSQQYLSQQNNWTIGVDYAEFSADVRQTESYNYELIQDAAKQYKLVKSLGANVSKSTYQVKFGSTLSLIVNLTPAEGVTLSNITVDGKTKKLSKNGSAYYAEITDIPATKLTETHNFVVGDTTVSASVMSYVYSALNSSTNENLKNFVCALYNYAEAVKK